MLCSFAQAVDAIPLPDLVKEKIDSNLAKELANSLSCTKALEVTGPISASTLDDFTRALKEAQKLKCSSVLVRINTPGGDLQSTRRIVELMLGSESQTFLCLVSPSGGQAGSAGAIILQACHVSGALKATNIGAATPVLGGGAKMSDDLRKKIVNDTTAWVESLAKLRNRNQKFAKEIVTEAKSLDAEAAAEIKAIDFVVDSEDQFLQKSAGREVVMKDDKRTAVQVGAIKEYQKDARSHLLALVTDPEIAYLMFIGSLALLYFEVTHPGMIAPGVIGGVGLIVSLMAMHKMEVEWAGLMLILLGLGLLIAEIFVPSFGMLGIGGFVSFVLGSVFLFNTEQTGYSLSWLVILPTALGLGATIFGIGYLSLSALKKSKDPDLSMKEAHVTVTHVDSSEVSGQVEVLGEFWNFESQDRLKVGDLVKIQERHGLTLKVQKRLS